MNQQIIFQLEHVTHTHTQIKSEVFLEDINNILNSGDVPNIYPPEDLDKILNEMKPVVQDAGLQPTKANLFSAYTKRVRSNIHMVICMRSDVCTILRSLTHDRHPHKFQCYKILFYNCCILAFSSQTSL